MNKRFALTSAGIATAAIGSTAAAELVTFTIHNDYYISENSWQIIDASSNTVASMFVSGGYIYIPTSQSSTYAVSFGLFGSSALTDGYLTTFQMDLAAGDYTIAMQDSWGDGWVWNSATGSDAFNATSANGLDYTLGMVSTSAVSGSFTVVPAPGALALLGLAGLTSRRKRK
ncbi:MAG: hypothetical protein CMJ33_02625 [Phycisphaerae bacterium]|nr:hypothetical protein [Phycisphaerae bacterium]HAW95788.1 hypothetical protein [Phycisphaerales bacterium]